jgi:hypothetical protein
MADSFLSPKVRALFAKSTMSCGGDGDGDGDGLFVRKDDSFLVFDDVRISDVLLRRVDTDGDVVRGDEWYLDVAEALYPVISECLDVLVPKILNFLLCQ